MRAILEKIKKSSASGFRTESIEGTYVEEPEVGKSFVIVGESLTEGANMRVVQTSRVKEIDVLSNSTTVIKTESGSEYKITYLLTSSPSTARGFPLNLFSSTQCPEWRLVYPVSSS